MSFYIENWNKLFKVYSVTLFLSSIHVRTTLFFRNCCVRELFSEILSSFQLLHRNKGGNSWSSVVNVSSLSVSLHFFFSFVHFLSDPISCFVFFLSFFHSLNRQRPLKSKRTQARNGDSFKEHPIMNHAWLTHPFQGPCCRRQQIVVQLWIVPAPRFTTI